MPSASTFYKLYLFRSDRRRLGIKTLADYVNLNKPALSSPNPGSYFDPGGAPPELPIPDSSPMYAGEKAQFWFWSIAGAAAGSYTSDDPDLIGRIPVVSVSDIQLTAWYFMGSGSTPDVVEVDAYSDDAQAFVDATPITACTPASAWGSGGDDDIIFTDKAHFGNAQNADIHVAASLPGDSFDLLPEGDPKQRFERFFFRPDLTSSPDLGNRTFQVNAGDAVAATASYSSAQAGPHLPRFSTDPILVLVGSDTGHVLGPIGSGGGDGGPLGLLIHALAGRLHDKEARNKIQDDARSFVLREVAKLGDGAPGEAAREVTKPSKQKGKRSRK